MPLVINELHGRRALRLIKSAIVAIVDNVSFAVDQTIHRAHLDFTKAELKYKFLESRFHPFMVLKVLPKLMNNTIASMMESDSEKPGNFLHHSEKALLGYCSFHHLFLELCKSYPIIQQKVDNQLFHFLRHESARVKKVVPDLGELLVYLTVASKTTWRHIGPSFMQEIYDRSVKWMVDEGVGKGHTELLFLESDQVSDYRLNVSFESSATGRRLLMFQVFFMDRIGRPKGMSLNNVLKRLNVMYLFHEIQKYGRPPLGMETVLHKECERIYGVKSWEEFYSKIDLPCPSKPELTTMLRQAVTNSARKGYHQTKVQNSALEKRMKVDKMLGKQPSAPVPPKSSTTLSKSVQVYISNLSTNANARTLESIFRQFGHVYAEILSSGICSIRVENSEVATTIMEFMQGFKIDGVPIRVELTKNKSHNLAKRADETNHMAVKIITPTVVTPPPVLPAATVPRSPRRDIWDENVRLSKIKQSRKATQHYVPREQQVADKTALYKSSQTTNDSSSPQVTWQSSPRKFSSSISSASTSQSTRSTPSSSGSQSTNVVGKGRQKGRGKGKEKVEGKKEVVSKNPYDVLPHEQ